MIPSVGLSWFGFRANKLEDEHEGQKTFFQSPLFVITVFFVICGLVGPFLVKSMAQKPVILQSTCPAKEVALSVRINKGSYVQIIADEAAPASHLPNLRLSDLVHSVKTFSYQEDFSTQPYQAGMVVLNTLDLRSKDQVWVAIPAAGLPVDGSLINVCGTKEKGSIFIFGNSFSQTGK
jgi:hypothetical protein